MPTPPAEPPAGPRSGPTPGALHPTDAHGSNPAVPYRLACLCDLRDQDGRMLLLRRAKPPNKGLCSPIGGKLDVHLGESPADCARREIREESGLDIPLDRLHLLGLIAEQAYEGQGHWLLFYFRVLGPVWVEPQDMDEGRLDWYHRHELDALPLPETDRTILWPLISQVEARTPSGRHGFFSLHIDCRSGKLVPRVDQLIPAVG